MFRLERQKVLPLFFALRMTMKEFARRAGVNQASAQRALAGRACRAPIIEGVARALSIGHAELLNYVEEI